MSFCEICIVSHHPDIPDAFNSRDCGWQGKTRNSTGGFTWDTTTIPSGIPALSKFIHNLGLNFGVYSDGYDLAQYYTAISDLWSASSGFSACDFVHGQGHYLGSLNHEVSDANSFASWGADYLKARKYFIRENYDNHHIFSMTTVMQVCLVCRT